MQIRDTAWNYGFTSILLHWVSAGLIAVLFILGQIAEDMSRGPEKTELMNVHQSLGMLLLIIVLARLVWRLGQGFPKSEQIKTNKLERLARAWHWLLLILIIAIPASGYLAAESGFRDLNFFGLFTLPDLIGTDRDIHAVFEEVHEIFSKLIIPVVLLHVLGALKHHYFDRDGTLKKMVNIGYNA